MNKIVTLLLALSISFSLLLTAQPSLVKAEPSVNLVGNPGFESALDNWQSQSGAKLDEMGAPHSGEFSCAVTGRTSAFSSPLQDMTKTFNQWGAGDYFVSAYVKIDDKSAVASDKMLLVFYATCDGQHKWLTASADISKSYTKIEGTITLAYAQKLASCTMYLQSSSGTTYDFNCDDFSVQKVNGKMEPMAEPTAQPVDEVKSRPDKTLVGAIRWDAYINPNVPAVGTTPDQYIGAQVSRCFAPSQYHFKLPFFGIVLSKDKVTFPDYTQEIFDQEMLYAKEAGIDYFMYDWYTDGMATARKLHATSKYKNDVKMTAMWDITSIPSSEYGSYIDILKQSYWQTVDNGRPMIYINNGGKQDIYTLNNFRNACTAAGLKNPYLIGIQQFGSTPALVKSQGLDAYSDYAIGASKGVPYSALETAAEAQWAADIATGVQYVPLVATGWDTRPIIDNGLSWYTTNADSWSQTATAGEIASHLQKALDFNKAHTDKTNINSVLIYAWNEHLEGGWICPTIIDDDGDGMPQLRADGTNARDTRRLQAIQQVLRPGSNWTLDKDIDLSVIFPSPISEVTSKPTFLATKNMDTEQPTSTHGTTNNSNSSLVFGGIGVGVGVAVLIIAAVVAAFLIKSKGKKADPKDNAPDE